MKILIKNGTIVDGTGSPAYKSDLLIKNGHIEKISQDLELENVTECKIIDATNKIVAPGFIDMHNHSDLAILGVNKAEASIMQGVTTLVVSMCGLGLAPAEEKVRNYYGTLISNVIGTGDLVLYDTLPELFSAIEEKRISPNLVFFIPHGNVRASVLGMDDRKPSEQELKKMLDIVENGMKAGAFGLSTGLIYPPGVITPTEELIEMCKIVKQYDGIYNSHMRDESTSILDQGMGELLKIAEEVDIQAHISHWKAGVSFVWKLTPDMINMVLEARKKGLKVFADIYPYEESSTSLPGAILPPWTFEDLQTNLTDQKIRQKVIDDTRSRIFSTYLSKMPIFLKIMPKSLLEKILFTVLKKIVRIISVKHNHQVEGKYLGEAIKTLYPNKNFIEAVLDFVRDEEGSIMISMKSMSEEKSIYSLFQQDFVCIGSDGFLVKEGNTHPRSYGTFARILSHYI
ncbi:MAG: amidohydrolase family protein, partial [archaeon]|nr:amidohydrolase family protein [archaeon]